MRKILTLLILILLVGCSYDGKHEVDEIEKCLKDKPMMNTTESILCYTDYWDIYCKYSYPMHCDKPKIAEFNLR